MYPVFRKQENIQILRESREDGNKYKQPKITPYKDKPILPRELKYVMLSLKCRILTTKHIDYTKSTILMS
jgi:hypothetical protein